MYELQNSELSTCLFQFSHKTRQTMLLYAYYTPEVDFKRKFNHHQSFLYEWWLTARTIRKFRIGPSIRIESRIGRTIRNRIESRSFAGPYTNPNPNCLAKQSIYEDTETVQNRVILRSFLPSVFCGNLNTHININILKYLIMDRFFCIPTSFTGGNCFVFLPWLLTDWVLIFSRPY